MRKLHFIFLLITFISHAQEKREGKFYVDGNYFYGNILPHSKSIYHLITGHPEGVMLSFNRRTFGEQEWQSAYNYPDYGASFHYQDMKNASLGEMYSLYGHYNFYFLKRNLMLRSGVGIAYNTNPYDKEKNFRNNAYGLRYMPTAYFMLNFTRPNVWNGFGIQAGLTFIHYSNGSLKAPNTSTNTFALNAGVNYTFNRSERNIYTSGGYDTIITYKTQPIRYNIALRAGICESDVIGTGQTPYYALSFYGDKRLGRKSAIQAGVDFFWPTYLKEFIKFKSTSFPEEGLDPDTDYRKVGAVIGHELFINKLSVITQLGVYIYSPYKATGSHYSRVGLKYYLTEKIFSSLTLKSHAANAEVIEFGVGIRL